MTRCSGNDSTRFPDVSTREESSLERFSVFWGICGWRSFSKNFLWIEGCLGWLCAPRSREMSMDGILQGELEHQSCLEAQKCSNLANQVTK